MKTSPDSLLGRLVMAARPTRPWLRITAPDRWARILTAGGARPSDVILSDADLLAHHSDANVDTAGLPDRDEFDHDGSDMEASALGGPATDAPDAHLPDADAHDVDAPDRWLIDILFGSDAPDDEPAGTSTPDDAVSGKNPRRAPPPLDDLPDDDPFGASLRPLNSPDDDLPETDLPDVDLPGDI